MKLNIYNHKEIVKTYEADAYDLMFGTVEDLAAAINLDKLETGTDAEIIKMIGGLVINSMDTVRELLKDIFEGITDDELKHVRVTEVAEVFLEVARFTITALKKIPARKN